jgi:hypothetical protein
MPPRPIRSAALPTTLMARRAAAQCVEGDRGDRRAPPGCRCPSVGGPKAIPSGPWPAATVRTTRRVRLSITVTTPAPRLPTHSVRPSGARLTLAHEDLDRAAARDDAAFVALSHFYAMTGEHRAGLELYRRLFAYARETADVQFMTLADYYRRQAA